MILLLALLLAQENVTLVVRPREKPGIFEKLARAGRRLFEKEQAVAAEGNALEAEHKHEEALKKYDQVAPQLGEDSTAQAAVQLDRSSALLGFGSPEKAPEAAGAAAKALQHGNIGLRAKGAYNLAEAFEQMGKADDALKMYQEALKLDPDDADAKVNLELLLRTEEKKKEQEQAQKPVDRSEAERLLDALRAGEKNLQAWRFAKEKRKDAKRGDSIKDW